MVLHGTGIVVWERRVIISSLASSLLPSASSSDEPITLIVRLPIFFFRQYIPMKYIILLPLLITYSLLKL